MVRRPRSLCHSSNQNVIGNNVRTLRPARLEMLARIVPGTTAKLMIGIRGQSKDWIVFGRANS
jgi:hypothetical protein